MEKKEKRTTGVTGLDYPLDGGFPVGESIVVYAHPLSGLDLMARQFWRPEDSTDEGSYLMLDAEPMEGMERLDSKTPLEEIVKKMKGSRIIIDSLSTLILTHGRERALEFIKKDIKEVLSSGSNVMFTLYKDLHSEEDIILLMRAADVFVELREQILGSEVERTFWIRKIRGQAVPQRVIPFLITEKGLELSTTSRVI